MADLPGGGIPAHGRSAVVCGHDAACVAGTSHFLSGKETIAIFREKWLDY